MKGRQAFAAALSGQALESEIRFQGAAVEEICFRGQLMTVGRFRSTPRDRDFETAGAIGVNPIFVFPRTAVWIQHEGQPAFVADRNVVTYYNPHQPYVRKKLSDNGDHCDFFQVRASVLQEVVRACDPGRAERADALFAFSHGPSDRRPYLSARLVARHIEENAQPDALYVEENLLLVLDACLRAAYRQRGRANVPARSTPRRKEDVAENARAVLALRFRDPLSLSVLAEAVGCSVFHLCRAFRRRFGTTIHRYRTQLRLRESLDLVGARAADLTQIALALGYSSHSHFTAEFRRAFGQPPSAFRNVPASQLFRKLAAHRAIF